MCLTVKGCDYTHCNDFLGVGRMQQKQGRIGPAYQVIADKIRDRIHAGEFAPGQRLPTEKELSAEYGYSVVTVRAAIRELNTAGIAESRHGAGTYVVDRRLITINATQTEDLDRRAGITAQDSWSTDVREAGRVPAQEFRCAKVAAAPLTAELLGVELGSPLVTRQCLRTVDGLPASVETSYFPAWLIAEIPELDSPHDIAQGTTSFVSERGFPMVWHEDELYARPQTKEEEAFFSTPLGVMTLVRLRVSHDQIGGGRVLRVMETAYRTDLHKVRYGVLGRGNVGVKRPEVEVP